MGVEAQVIAPHQRGVKYTLYLALAPTGVVVWWLVQLNCNIRTLSHFITHHLLPTLHQPCTIMWDNLSVHRNVGVCNLLLTANHDVLFRPAYSPDYAPVEVAFFMIKSALRQNQTPITTTNIHHRMALAIQHVTAAKCWNAYQHCGYFP
jgi:putative transposase